MITKNMQTHKSQVSPSVTIKLFQYDNYKTESPSNTKIHKLH